MTEPEEAGPVEASAIRQHSGSVSVDLDALRTRLEYGYGLSTDEALALVEAVQAAREHVYSDPHRPHTDASFVRLTNALAPFVRASTEANA